ncbi:hypothetical protein BC941DRAFT_423801 [Chlamydoabsidia padenii]|nr:hypothetical protein BC941DRAFT_423801 [Chlamydoabsidia padenii]
MLSLRKSFKTIEIKIVEEKYFFPGQTIKGLVNIHPKSPTKTTHIVVKFTGEVTLSVKDKATLTLFQQTKIVNLIQDEEQVKCYIMEPKLHTFPFEFVVPDDIQLPSTMEFNKKARIRYTLSALHDKPMVPESLCPKTEYPVHILEFIDIDDNKYRIPQDKYSQMLLPKSNPTNQCGVRVLLPRYGFTRGDIVPLSLTIYYFEPFCLKQAIDINLIRTVEIRNGKSIQFKEDILKSTKCDIEINDPLHPSQTMKRQLLIPTSTPPTIEFRGNLLRIQYKVRICVQLVNPSLIQQQQRDNKKAPQQNDHCTVDIPIVVGTWPRAAIPIDDDDDDDDGYTDNMNNNMTMEDTDFIDISNSASGSDSEYGSVISRNSNSIHLAQQRFGSLRGSPMTESSSGNSSSSTIRPIIKSTSNNLMNRSDSVNSKGSIHSYASYSSYQSNQSWGNSTASLSRNTSLSTTVSIPEPYHCNNTTNTITALPETITVSASPCFNTKNNNKYISSLSQHRGSDPTGMTTTQSTSIQHRHSLNGQQQYPVLVGPSSLKYQKHQSMIFSTQSSPSDSSNRFSASDINLTRSSSPPIASPTSSHRRLSSSTCISKSKSMSPIPLSPLSPLSPTISNAILLQPVDTIRKETTIKTIHVPTHEESACRQDLDLEDEDDDEEDDFLTIMKRKQEQILLDERTRLHMTEMKI